MEFLESRIQLRKKYLEQIKITQIINGIIQQKIKNSQMNFEYKPDLENYYILFSFFTANVNSNYLNYFKLLLIFKLFKTLELHPEQNRLLE